MSAAATLLVGMGALEIGEIIEARRSLQGSCLTLAVKNAGQQHLQDIENSLQRQSEADISDEAFCQADVAFHRALVDATDNGMLRFVMYTVIESLIPLTNMVVTVVRQRSDIIDLHQHMLDCLHRRDAQALIATMDELLDYLLDRFEQAREVANQESVRLSVLKNK